MRNARVLGPTLRSSVPVHALTPTGSGHTGHLKIGETAGAYTAGHGAACALHVRTRGLRVPEALHVRTRAACPYTATRVTLRVWPHRRRPARRPQPAYHNGLGETTSKQLMNDPHLDANGNTCDKFLLEALI